MQCFASEIAQLRALGFAEALPIGRCDPTQGAVARLESGRHGLAVEFFVPGAEGVYCVVSLESQVACSLSSDLWSEVIRNVRHLAPPGDDD